jgi:septal ring-binding cell division protein DamX
VRNVLVGAGVVVLVIVALGVGLSLGSKHNNAGSSSTAEASASASTVAKYKNATDLLAAMAAGGAVCGNAQFRTGSTVQGAQSAYIGCDGASSGDTVLLMFTSHKATRTPWPTRTA